MSKISIIGAGEVGASCAMCLAERDFVNEIVLLDVKQGLAEGKALDLRQSAAIKRFDTVVKGVTADYAATADSDVIVITSGIFILVLLRITSFFSSEAFFSARACLSFILFSFAALNLSIYFL